MIDREPDPYQVLGIGPDATGADIARAYRRLARAVHPDSRPGDPAAAGQFRALTDAYGLLSDPARRAAWDHHHPSREARHPHRPAPAWPASPPPWPFRPAGQHWPGGGAAGSAALRAGPVHVQQPVPPGRARPARPGVDPSLVRLYWWLLADGREWPW
jgi:curved DNA-binding protein CbpA